MKQHHHRFPALLSLLGMLAVSALAQAQQVYRTTGPDGKVTFSDRPPLNNSAPATKTPRTDATTEGLPNAPLPYELRLIATRFPVTLYTSADCAPCASARNLLINRGIPFAERTVSSNEDIEAFQRLSGNSGLPLGSIGGQQLSGFSSSEWTQYLDAAGYPKQSQLPANYRRPAATPMVAAKAAEPAAAQPTDGQNNAPAARPKDPVQPRGPAPGNPAGIRF